ncbi:MAG TPA: ATP synthase F0 subunit B, partial [Gemmatales bacterium]|nr:ATP synthase F0 subunit B [Gemmatales bacterium]HMP15954.1 ATP synthase F0 subunit B [Gemmatales bacterium]
MLRVIIVLMAGLLPLGWCSAAWASDKAGHGHVYEADVKDDQGHDKTDVFDLSKSEDANRLASLLAQGKVTMLKQEHIPAVDQMASLRWDLGLWSIVVFGGLLFILSKTAWPAMLEGLKKREQNISDAISAAETARQEAERTRQELKAEMAKANDNIRAMMDEARKDATVAKEEMLASAKKEIGEERDRLRREIDTARDQALLDIWNQSTQLASMLSSKTIQREIRPEDHKKLFDEALKEMKAAVGKGTM